MMRESLNGVMVSRLDKEGPKLGSVQSGLDLIGDSSGQDIEMFAIPVQRLDPEFFRLGSGIAGAFMEKLQQYGFRLAIVGDIGEALGRSTPLQDFVRETNRRGQHLFVADEGELRARLQPR
jgi:hypothetical protein